MAVDAANLANISAFDSPGAEIDRDTSGFYGLLANYADEKLQQQIKDLFSPLPLAKQERSRTVRSLASLNEATRKGLTFLQVVHLFLTNLCMAHDNYFHVLR